MDQMHDTFSIEVTECHEWQLRGRKNNFFELVYILEGSGKRCAGETTYHYHENGIFLLPVARCHRYLIEKPTKFLFIRFTSGYFKPDNSALVDYSEWFSRLNFILGNYDGLPGELIADADDKLQVKRLLDVILFEYRNRGMCSGFVMQSALASALGVICRSIQKRILKGRDLKDSKISDIINFISFNILDNEKLSVTFLSRKFNISQTYFSEFFRRNAGERFQDHIMGLRLKIAESRALYTDAPFQQIANELSFTDSSHLNKMMKKHYGTGMRDLRKGGIVRDAVV